MKRRVTLSAFFFVGALAMIASAFFVLQSARAASFSNVQDTLSTVHANRTSGVNHTFSFTVPAGNIGIESRIVATFPLNDNGTWCRTAGGDLQITPSSADGATPLPGTFNASCTQGNGTTTYDTFTVTGVNDLAANTKYAFTISDGSLAKLGTPPSGGNHLVLFKTQTNSSVDIDSGNVGVAIVANDTITISAIVPPPTPPEDVPATVTFQGYAYPNAQIRILKDGIQIGTGTAGANAAFSVSVSSLPGSYTFTVIGRDVLGRDGTLTNVALTLTSGGSVSIGNMFLSPTIAQDKTTITTAESIVFSGISVPGSSISLTVESDPITYSTTADSQGQWSVSVPGSAPGVGSHTAKATSTFSSLTSSLSSILSFVVQGAVVNQCDGKVAADINCDGKVDLVDFSIMLFYWLSTNPANPRADINGDTKVDETDFSILLFYWTG